MGKIEMYIVKALSFQCSNCGWVNHNEFDKGDTKTHCSSCMETFDINIVGDYSD